MTKTETRAVNRRIRALQRERRDWLTGAGMPWGIPWCQGPGTRGHQDASCEGCDIRLWHRDRADEVTERIRQLQEALAPAGQPVQGGLW